MYTVGLAVWKVGWVKMKLVEVKEEQMRREGKKGLTKSSPSSSVLLEGKNRAVAKEGRRKRLCGEPGGKESGSRVRKIKKDER